MTTENFSWLILDADNNPVLAASPLPTLTIREPSGDIYDWNDGVFKSSGWTTVAQNMAVVDATNSPGEYSADLTITLLSGNYYARADYQGVGNIRHQVVGFNVKEGVVTNLLQGLTVSQEAKVDNIPTLISALDAVVDTVKAETVLILADTDDLQTTKGDRATATGFNTATPLDASGVRAAIGLSSANIDTQFAASATATGFNTVTPLDAADIRDAIGLSSADMDAQFTASATVTGFATEAKQDTIDGVVDQIRVDTNTTIPNQITALNDISVSDVLTTQMTEAYAADGTAPTLTQALMLIQQVLTEFNIAGTTYTIKKVDGSTTAATGTLNNATDPTGMTRAS